MVLDYVLCTLHWLRSPISFFYLTHDCVFGSGINLYNNQFTGQLPDSLGNLKNLERFSAAVNLFEGSVPESFGGLSSLT